MRTSSCQVSFALFTQLTKTVSGFSRNANVARIIPSGNIKCINNNMLLIYLKLTWLSWGKHCNVVLMLKINDNDRSIWQWNISIHTTKEVKIYILTSLIQPRCTLGILTIDRLIDHKIKNKEKKCRLALKCLRKLIQINKNYILQPESNIKRDTETR